MTRFCSLVSGSSGNALYLEHKNTKILIDCGISCLRICEALKLIDVNPADIDGVFVTHEHSDHVSGIKVFTKKFNCPVYAGEKTLEKITCYDGKAVVAGEFFELGDIAAMPFDIPHDAAQPFGYTFMLGGVKLSIATDMGKIDAGVAEILRGSEFVFIESNHDTQMLKTGPYPYYLKERIIGSEGHLSNDQSAALVAALARTGTTQFVLGHLSNTNNTPQMALNTVANALMAEGHRVGSDIMLDVAKRHSISKIYEI